MTLIFQQPQGEPEPPKLPSGKRGRFYIKRIFFDRLRAQQKITIEEAIDLLIEGWPKQ